MKTMDKKQMAVWAISTIVLMGVSFYGGAVHGKKAAAGAATQVRGQFAGMRTGGRTMFGSGFITGDVIAKDATSITVKMRDGSTKIVLYSGTTQVTKSASGSASDVLVGSPVLVQGSSNSDGSVTAQSIQLRPAGAPGMPTTAPEGR